MRKTRIFLRSYRLLGTLPRFVRKPQLSPASSGKRIATVVAPVSRIFAYHFELGPIPISESPHVSYVRKHLGLPMSNQEDQTESWHSYISRQHELSTSEFKRWEDRYQQIIQEVSENHRWTLPDVRLRPGYAILVDGFHRCAIAYALDSRCKVKVWIND